MARLLVVEDEESNREFLKFVLENAGHAVEAVGDGQAALDAVAARPPELIVLDVMLPELHGYEVCHRVKTNPKTNRIKVIMLTAKAFPADRHQAKDVGANDFIAKPVDPSLLLEHVTALTSGAKTSYFDTTADPRP